MKSDHNPTFDQLREAAKRKEWEYVDAHLTLDSISPNDFIWAERAGVTDADQEVRDFAATVLIVGKMAIDLGRQSKLEELMDTDPYYVVSYRLAIALYRRGNRNSRVIKMMEAAKADPDIGPIASKFLRAA